MTSDARRADRPEGTDRPEEDRPEEDRPDEEAATEPKSAAAGADEEAAVPPPADFDPAEHPSNPDLVADDEDPAR